MWISKKKFNQMVAEAVEKERERNTMYNYMDDIHTRIMKIEARLEELDANSKSATKRRLNG